MHDVLFRNQDALEDEDLIMYAARIGIDFQRVSQELAAGTYTRKARDDCRGGIRGRALGTFALFLYSFLFGWQLRVLNGLLLVLVSSQRLRPLRTFSTQSVCRRP